MRILGLAKELQARPVEHYNLLAAAKAQDLHGMAGFAPGQQESLPLALFRRQVEAVDHWKNFLAFSKKRWVAGLSLPLHNSANSMSFAFCAAARWVGTSILTRTWRSPRP